MFYGHKQHVNSPEDLTIIKCRRCGWISKEMTRAECSALGVPWYCDDCGYRVAQYVTFHPGERAAAYFAIEETA
jgi:ribosomal protein L37E